MAHVVAQEVEAELAHGCVHDVGSVCAAPLVVVHVLQHGPDGEAQRLVDRGQLLRVPQGEVVVRRDDMHPPTLHGVADGGEGCGEGLTLSRTHLDDLPAPHVQPGEDLLAGGRESQRIGHRGLFDRPVELSGQVYVAGLIVSKPLHDRDERAHYEAVAVGHSSVVEVRAGFSEVLGHPPVVNDSLVLESGIEKAPRSQAPSYGLIDNCESRRRSVVPAVRPCFTERARQPTVGRIRERTRPDPRDGFRVTHRRHHARLAPGAVRSEPGRPRFAPGFRQGFQ